MAFFDLFKLKGEPTTRRRVRRKPNWVDKEAKKTGPQLVEKVKQFPTVQAAIVQRYTGSDIKPEDMKDMSKY